MHNSPPINRTFELRRLLKRDGEEGFVLVPAVWLAGLIAVALSAFLLHLKLDIKIASNVLENARSEFLADGVARLVAYELATGNGDELLSGTAYECQLIDGHVANIKIQDQAGLVDLNGASAATLSEVGKMLGLEAALAQTVSDRIVDFRDRDDSPRPRGAEASEYSAAGLKLPPKNAPFQDIAELDQVIGMTNSLRSLLANAVTVYSEQDGIDPAVAPPELRSTKENGIPAVVSQKKVFAINVLISKAGGGAFHRYAVVRVLRRTERPSAVIEWSRGSSAAAAALKSGSSEKCPLKEGTGFTR